MQRKDVIEEEIIEIDIDFKEADLENITIKDIVPPALAEEIKASEPSSSFPPTKLSRDMMRTTQNAPILNIPDTVGDFDVSITDLSIRETPDCNILNSHPFIGTSQSLAIEWLFLLDNLKKSQLGRIKGIGNTGKTMLSYLVGASSDSGLQPEIHPINEMQAQEDEKSNVSPEQDLPDVSRHGYINSVLSLLQYNASPFSVFTTHGHIYAPSTDEPDAISQEVTEFDEKFKQVQEDIHRGIRRTSGRII